MMKKYLALLALAASAQVCSHAENLEIFLRGDWYNNWSADNGNKFSTTDGNIYTIDNVAMPAGKLWKVASEDWKAVDFGGPTNQNPYPTEAGGVITLTAEGSNCTLTADYSGPVNFNLANGQIIFGEAPEKWPSTEPALPISNTLPVLYINIFQTDADGNATDQLDDYVISMDLADKNYRPGVYWLDVDPCPYAAKAGYKSIGSREEPLPLEMKARGNYTRTAFAKKPFKLKLGKKQSLLGMTPDKSKHWAILAHADDNCGYLRNFVGFNLGHRIGLPWTPDMQPVEVVINGDYRGLYFLTESIRVGDGRVPVQELDDNATNPMLASGGYLVELDNYDEENQIQMSEASCAGVDCDMLRITWDTPEDYSDLQRRFVGEQFATMNSLVGKANTAEGNDLWKYLDLDDAVRYYIVEELISHTESYHGSTYLFRDRGEDQKWHFSPLWDCGNAFNGPTDNYFFNSTLFGNTWIPSLMLNDTFLDKVKETWKWFMANGFNGLFDDIATYTDRIAAAAVADHNRWGSAPSPMAPVQDNSNITEKRQLVTNHINAKINWLKDRWGDFAGTYTEPERDTTPAAELPYYVNPTSEAAVMDIYFTDATDNPWSTVYCYVEDGSAKPLGEGVGSQMYKETVGTEKYFTIHFYPEQPLSANAKVYFYNPDTNTKIGPFDFLDEGLYSRTGSGTLISGCADIAAPDPAAPTFYFDLMGRPLASPLSGGVTIVRRGATATKELR